MEAAKVAKMRYDAVKNDPNSTPEEIEAARQEASYLISSSTDDIRDNLSKFGASSLGAISAYNKLENDLLSGVDSDDRPWLTSALSGTGYDKALSSYEVDGLRPLDVKEDSWAAKAIMLTNYGVATMALDAFEEGNAVEGVGIIASNVLPSEEIAGLQTAFKTFLRSRNTKDHDATLEDFNEFLEQDEAAEPLRLGYIEGNRRYLPGAASHGGSLPRVEQGDTWLKGTQGNAGKVPAQVAEKLAGREFKTFDEFRSAFWKEVADDPVLSQEFAPQSLGRMRNGNAPFAHEQQQVGGRQVYELDHMQEIQDGGNVYDMNNIIIRTPYNHINKGKD